jgi:hypothetical protein
MNLPGPAWFLCAALLLQHCSETALTGNGGASETVNAKVMITDTTVSVMVDESDNGKLSMRIFSPDYRPYEKRGFTDSVPAIAGYEARWQ